MKPRVGVSACLLGEPVRYNAGHCRNDLLTGDLARHLEYVPVCPEMEAGLGAPRLSFRLEGSREAPRAVTQDGDDLTPRLLVASRERVDALAALDVDGFILKKDSPTCGLSRVRVYRDNGIPSRDGVGLFARELTARMPLLPVEEEGRLRAAATREHFLTRVFARRRIRDLVASAPEPRDLVAFHAREKLLLLAHHEPLARELGRLVARAGARGRPPTLVHEYATGFQAALAKRPTRGTQANVLLHLLGHVEHVERDERAGLIEAIDEYRRGLVPLVVPARLLLHHVRRESDWAAAQRWFEPAPAELRLRTETAA